MHTRAWKRPPGDIARSSLLLLLLLLLLLVLVLVLERPMPQRDYILRLIEQLGQALIRVRKMILGEEVAAGRVDDELRLVGRRVGVDLDIARLATPETLGLLVAPTGEPDPGRCWVLAEMLYLDGLEAETRGRAAAARASYDKAVRLFRLVEPGGAFLTGWPEAGERIREIEARVQALTTAPNPPA